MPEDNKDDPIIKKVKQWASDNGYQLIEISRASDFEGPATWSARSLPTNVRQKQVYRITIGNQQGEIIQGWLKLSYWLMDISSAEIEVLWDSDKPPLYSDSKGIGWINRMTVIVVVVVYALILIFIHPQPYKIWDFII